MDCSLPCSSVHGISQARILEWVITSLSKGSSQPGDRVPMSLDCRQIPDCWATREAPRQNKSTWKLHFWAEWEQKATGSDSLLEGEGSPRPFWHWVVVAIFWEGHVWLCLSNVPATKWKIQHFTGCFVASLRKHLIDVLDWIAQKLSVLEFNALMSEMIKMHWRILASSSIKRCSMGLYWVGSAVGRGCGESQVLKCLQQSEQVSLLWTFNLSKRAKGVLFIEVWLIYSVLLVSGIQHSNSVIHLCILFQILFPYRLLQNTEYSSLCYTVGPFWIYIL